MNLPSYPAMTDSGLQWLGEYPSHWRRRRAKFLMREVDERSATGAEEMLSVSHLTGVTPRSQKKVTMFKAESYEGHKLCRPGDVVVNTLWAWMAALGVSRHIGIVSPAYGVYRLLPSSGVEPAFLDYLLRTGKYAAEYLRRSTGIQSSRLRLYPDKFLDIPLLVPEPAEQGHIVRFLQGKDRGFFALIQKKRRLIELLNEQKQILIHRAVTGGLDRSAPRKPTGFEWLEEMPDNWSSKRLKFLVRNVNEQTSVQGLDEIYVALEHIEGWTGRLSPPDEPSFFDSQVRRFQAGDILFGKLRPYLAKVTRPTRKGVCVGELLVLRHTDKAVAPEFLELVLRSTQLIAAVNRSTFGAKMPRADWGFIGNLRIPYPTLPRQLEIVRQVATDTLTLSKAIERAAREIELIREFRDRLVTDVVTGQVDVREAAPASLPDEFSLASSEDGLIDEAEETIADADDRYE